MAVPKARIDALKVLVASTPVAGSPEETLVCDEYDQVLAAGRVPGLQRSSLLEILHSTRALDSFLKAFLNHFGYSTKNLGSHLHALEKQPLVTAAGVAKSNFTIPQRKRYVLSIAVPRNRYMHQAGTFPANVAEVLTLISEMDACLNDVVNL